MGQRRARRRRIVLSSSSSDQDEEPIQRPGRVPGTGHVYARPRISTSPAEDVENHDRHPPVRTNPRNERASWRSAHIIRESSSSLTSPDSEPVRSHVRQPGEKRVRRMRRATLPDDDEDDEDGGDQARNRGNRRRRVRAPSRELSASGEENLATGESSLTLCLAVGSTSIMTD